MPYFNKYYLEFADTRGSNYRIDILDSVGSVPTDPYKLQGSTPALITTRLNENDNKQIGIIGREITLSYIYTGNANEPVPDDFFDAPERRFRVEVRINSVLDGVYYVKGDFSSAPYDAPPYRVQIKAVDGLAYTKSVDFDMMQDNLLYYDRIDLYEAAMTRGLLQVLDPGTKMNVLNSLYPTNIAAGLKMLFNVYVHTDNFFDFTTGPLSTHEAINMIAVNLRCRVFIEENTVWVVRIQDLTYSIFNIDQYTGPAAAETIEVDMIATAGPSISNDATPISTGTKSSQPGYKSVQYKAAYRSVNRLVNFDWRSFDGSSFEFWGGVEGIERRGTGTIADLYRAFLAYNFTNPGSDNLMQEVGFIQTIPPTLIGPAFVGDTLEITIPYNFINTDTFNIQLRIQSNNPGSVHYLSSGGSWIPGIASFVTIKRSKKKQRGSYTVITDPIPTNSFGTNNYAVFLSIYTPTGLVDFEGLATAGVEIFPVKLGINNSSSKSFVTKAVNAADYSKVNDEEPFNLFDNGDVFSANVLTVNPFGDHEPVSAWDSDKANVSPEDIEYHMTRAYIDQYSRSVRMWEGSMLSNTLKYYQLVEFSHIPGKRFLQISTTFDNENCTYTSMNMLEVLEEGNAELTYTEYDIEEEKD